jgi:DUF971 family protein
MASYQPKLIRRSDPARIEIEWSDGHTSVFTTPELRGLCPCAQCVNELTGVRVHSPASVPADLTHQQVRLVGNYGLALAFSDGHDTGIFTFQFLRERDPRG